LDPDPSKHHDVLLAWDYDNDCIPDLGESFSLDDFWATYPDGTWDYASMGD